jgi:hypothetical protein
MIVVVIGIHIFGQISPGGHLVLELEERMREQCKGYARFADDRRGGRWYSRRTPIHNLAH